MRGILLNFLMVISILLSLFHWLYFFDNTNDCNSRYPSPIPDFHRKVFNILQFRLIITQILLNDLPNSHSFLSYLIRVCPRNISISEAIDWNSLNKIGMFSSLKLRGYYDQISLMLTLTLFWPFLFWYNHPFLSQDQFQIMLVTSNTESFFHYSLNAGCSKSIQVLLIFFHYMFYYYEMCL